MTLNSNSTSMQDIIHTLSLEGQAILHLAHSIAAPQSPHARQWMKALELLNTCLNQHGKIIVSGVGKSGKIAQKISATLSSTGSFSIFLHPTEALHGDLGFVREHDIVLALSYTGNTEELLKLIPSFKNRRVPLIAITGNPQSQLALHSAVVLDASVKEEACPHNLAPTTSSTLALAMGDALAVSLMKLRGFNSSDFAKNHPGGSLGKKLHLTVEEIMHQGDQLACLGPESTMDQVVIASTQKKLGAVLVCEGKKLLGLITDGDIRRALSHKEHFFSMRAKEIMSTSPISASPEMLASEALALMQNRPSQISVLPVVNSQNTLLGMIRLHDIVQAM